MMAEAIQDATMALKKALIERALGGELNHHLGYPPGGDKPAEAGNHRNGSTGKTALTEDGPLRIEVPRMVRGSERPEARSAGSKVLYWRARRDSNPRYWNTSTPDFESGAFDHSATCPVWRRRIGRRLVSFREPRILVHPGQALRPASTPHPPPGRAAAPRAR